MAIKPRKLMIKIECLSHFTFFKPVINIMKKTKKGYEAIFLLYCIIFRDAESNSIFLQILKVKLLTLFGAQADTGVFPRDSREHLKI